MNKYYLKHVKFSKIHLKIKNVLFQLVLMDIMGKIALGNAMRPVLVVTQLTDCVILAVIQDGRETTVSNVRGYSVAY